MKWRIPVTCKHLTKNYEDAYAVSKYYGSNVSEYSIHVILDLML